MMFVVVIRGPLSVAGGGSGGSGWLGHVPPGSIRDGRQDGDLNGFGPHSSSIVNWVGCGAEGGGLFQFS